MDTATAQPLRRPLINLANYYLRCADVHVALLSVQKKMLASDPSPEKVQNDVLQLHQDLRKDFLTVAYDLYKLAGRELTPDVLKPRMNINTPHTIAAVEELTQRALLKVDGKRAPPKPNIYDLCTRQLGEEIRNDQKLDARRKAFYDEASQIARTRGSCLK